MANNLHTDLQEKLGDDYEVIFEVGVLQVRRAGDRAFIAVYDTDKNVVRAGPHVIFPGHEGENHDDLSEQGRKRLEPKLEEWRDFGFEPLEDGHVMDSTRPLGSYFRSDVPRYIQPMGLEVDSLDDVVEAVEWIRTHRDF